jgi:hypothetical protein
MTRFFVSAILVLCFYYGEAQGLAHLNGKKYLLKGKWQLTSASSLGKDHAIAKDEYDGTMTFRSFHRYTEEVHYESNHWIIKGKWKTFRHSATLLLTRRLYTIGQLEKNPPDITFNLEELDKSHWLASSIARGEAVKVTYRKISRKAK